MLERGIDQSVLTEWDYERRHIGCKTCLSGVFMEGIIVGCKLSGVHAL